ncbi:histidine kinase N-terminal 7TM domain-containing protein [Natrinema longum]|uniref:histidine kinase n=1 Tax=Natrinema longum TaxID=370324 RepID=A0A8A2U8Z0_9EURY|nr:histidine kinase N-terminal 7TM domain-containing protein [Natrinema longum]MBZ6493970.1 PAS domain-containing protein [Natrinema longum]QSW84695.1 PAS domain-containing protein [Natrinema longum]
MAFGTGIAPIQLVYLIVVFNSVALAGVLWRHRDRPGAVPLLVNVLSTGLWAGSLLARTVVDRGLVARVFLVIVFLSIGLYLLTLLVFTLEYTGRERFIRPSIVAALSIEPILVIIFVAVNPDGLFFTVVDGTVEWGIGFWIHTAYAYTILAVVTMLIFGLLYRSQAVYRGQIAVMLVGTIAAWTANSVYVFDLVDVEVSPVGFLVTGILYAIGIVHYRLTDLVPIARDRVLDNVSDGIFVVDEQDRLIDLNPAGRALLEDIDSAPIGKRLESLLADYPELRDEYRALTATRTDGDSEVAVAGGHYHLRTTPLEDGRDRHIGWLCLIRDITDRKRQEAQVERQNERLERFASVVSHDLRNPLNVAEGYLDLAREADDPEPSLDEIEQSHDRMAAIIEDVLALARDGTTITDPEPVSLAALAERAWENVDTGDAALVIASETTILADADRVTRLLENLFRNAIEHGAKEPTSQASHHAVEHGPADGPEDTTETEASGRSSLTVEVGTIGTDGADGPAGFYVADDGRGLPDDGDVFEDGYTTNPDGTGFGLSIVSGIATAHGWTVEAGESEHGGARFEFRRIETGDDATGSTPRQPADANPNGES